MPAGLIVAGVAAAATVGGAVISSNAQKKATREASQVAQQTTDRNIALEQQVRAENKGILSPYVETGNRATGALNDLVYGADGGASLKALEASPGYQFRYNQGMGALNTGWAARGLLNSGAAQKAAITFGQGIASEEYNNRFNQLTQQQGVGLAAGNALAGVNTSFANSVTNQNNALATVLANSALARGQSTGQMWGTVGSALGQFGGQMISSYRPAPGQPAIGTAGGVYGPYSTPPYAGTNRYGYPY